jgi:hypothetical protein
MLRCAPHGLPMICTVFPFKLHCSALYLTVLRRWYGCTGVLRYLGGVLDASCANCVGLARHIFCQLVRCRVAPHIVPPKTTHHCGLMQCGRCLGTSLRHPVCLVYHPTNRSPPLPLVPCDSAVRRTCGVTSRMRQVISHATTGGWRC